MGNCIHRFLQRSLSPLCLFILSSITSLYLILCTCHWTHNPENDKWPSVYIYIYIFIHDCVRAVARECKAKSDARGRPLALLGALTPSEETINTLTSPAFFLHQGQVGCDYSTTPRSTSPPRMRERETRDCEGGKLSWHQIFWCEICAREKLVVCEEITTAWRKMWRSENVASEVKWHGGIYIPENWCTGESRIHFPPPEALLSPTRARCEEREQ